MNEIEKLHDIEVDFNESVKTGRMMVVPGDIKWLIKCLKQKIQILETIKKECEVPDKYFEI